MLKIERRCVDFVYRHLAVIALAAAVMVSLFIRWQLRTFQSGDMNAYLLPWMKLLKTEGIAETMRAPNCDYNFLYMLLLKIFSYIPIAAAGQIKLLSTLFDYLAAGASALIVYQLMPKGADRALKAAVAGVIMLLMPTVFANSAIWGQCDVIFAFFLLMCVFFLLREQFTLAFLMFSLALCFKLQAILFAPVLIVLYFSYRKFSILQFLQPPAWLTFFGWFALSQGSGIFLGLEIYARQAIGKTTSLFIFWPNFWVAFRDVEDGYSLYAPIGIAAALAVFACFMAFAAYRRWRPEKDALLLLAAWCVFTCTHFLPSMHERYAFAGEWFLCLYFLAKPSVKRFFVLAPSYFIAMLGYPRYLWDYMLITFEQMSIVNILGYVLITAALARRVTREGCPGQAAKATENFARMLDNGAAL